VGAAPRTAEQASHILSHRVSITLLPNKNQFFSFSFFSQLISANDSQPIPKRFSGTSQSGDNYRRGGCIPTNAQQFRRSQPIRAGKRASEVVGSGNSASEEGAIMRNSC
jgi:hypothetical protein